MNNKYKILLVEDDENIRIMVGAMLESAGYQVIETSSCNTAITLAVSHIPDLILLDLGLPDMDGIKLLEYVRKTDLTPIIILSARSDEMEKVKAFDMGANDYITKPFSAAEFLARVRSALRFSRHSADEGCLAGETFRFRDLRIEYDARRVFVGDREVKLTQTEYNILAYLSESSGKLLTYSSIIKAIWGQATEGSVKRLQVNMANIRRKLGIQPGEYSYIVNELGVGYRMNTD
ncbi:MAG: response regulator transcription factor [Erysipelotrichaceae bacterium]|nr:response regulator transcription factor [Erysipelotrichaceae bacterium]